MNKKNPVIALVQHPPVFLNLKASIDKACELIKEAAKHPADLILFPETWLPGYPVWLDVAPEAGLWDHPPVKKLHRILLQNAIEDAHPLLKKLQETIAQANCHVVMGVHEKDGGTLYNAMLYFDIDGSFTKHRKLMPTYTERLIWGMGDGSTLGTLDTDFGTVGGLICWEHWMPMARVAMHAKDEQIHVAQWPYVKDLHQLCSRHYAFEGQCFVAATGGILSKQDMLDGIQSLGLSDDEQTVLDFLNSIPAADDDLLLQGGSAIIAPDTSYMLEPVYNKSDIFYSEIDLNLISEGNLAMDSDGHYARPDVFNLQVNTAPQQNVTFSAKENTANE